MLISLLNMMCLIVFGKLVFGLMIVGDLLFSFSVIGVRLVEVVCIM